MLNRISFFTPLLAILFVCNLALGDTELKRAVESILDIGWPGSYKTRAAADEQFRVVQSVERGDERAVYAYILVLIKQRRYPEADNLLGKLVAHDEDDIYAWKAKAWLSMLLKKYDRSLSDMDRISVMLADTDLSKKLKVDDIEFAQFLGRMIGYLEGPAAGSINESTLNKQTVRIDARLTDEQADAFETARQSVVDEFQGLTSESEDTKKEAEVEAAKQREQLREELDEEAEQLEGQREAIAPKVDKLREEAREELKLIVEEEKPLLKELNQLDAQAFDLRREQTNVSTSALALQQQASETKDPATRGALELRVSDLAILSDRYRRQLNLLERRAGQIQAQRAQLARRYEETKQRYEKSLNKLGAELKSIEKLEKRNAYQAKKATKPGSADLRRTRSLATKAKALSTYQDFSLEDERKRVLDLF